MRVRRLTAKLAVAVGLVLLGSGTQALGQGNQTGDGHVLHWSNGRTDAPQRLHAGGDRPAESIRIVGSGGLTRVFFVDTSLYVYARVLGDSFTCRYEAGGQTLRRVEVAEDVIVAINDLRDRIICWHPNEPARPFANVGVAQMTGRSVQDVCLLPAV